MLHYLVKRLLGLLPTLFLVAVIVFLFVHMLPGDPARLAAGPEADQVTVELVRKDLGLDKPLPEQFITYFGNIITKGDFGTSLRTKRPVSVEIGERFAATFWLTVWSMVWSVFFGLIIGMISATKRNKWQDHAGMALAVSGISFPTFALGLLLMEIFSVSLGVAAHRRGGLVETLHFAVHYVGGGRRRGHGPVHPCVFCGNPPG